MLKTRTRTLTRMGAAVAVAALALTGCSSAPDINEILADAEHNFEEAESLRLEFDNFTSSGDTSNGHIQGALDDSYMDATLTSSAGTVDMVTVDGASYVKGDDTFWEESVGSFAAGIIDTSKWVDVGSNTPITLSSFAEELSSLTEINEGEGPEGEAAELNGESVYRYAAEDPNGAEMVMFFTEDHFLRRVEVSDDSGEDSVSGNVNFVNWNEVEAPTAPPAEEVVSIPGF